MTWGDKESVEKSKLPDPSPVDTGDSGRNNSHCEMGRIGVMQAVAQIWHGDNDAQDWDAEFLNHVLVHILNNDQVEASATNDFTVFVIANGIDDVRLLLTVSKDDFKLMGHHIDFKTFRALQALNKMCNEQVSDALPKDNEKMWFLNLGKRTVMRHMMQETKMNMMSLAMSVTVPNVPLGQSNSNKAQLEKARQSSSAMDNV